MILKKFLISFLFVLLTFSASAEEIKDNNLTLNLVFIQVCLILVMMEKNLH